MASERLLEVESNPETWVLFIQRAIFAFAVVALGLSFAVGFLARGLVEEVESFLWDWNLAGFLHFRRHLHLSFPENAVA